MTETAPNPNVALADAIEESGLRKGFIADQVGVAPATLSRWLSGHQQPEKLHREKLAILLRRNPVDFLRPSRSEETFHTAADAHSADSNAAVARSDATRRTAA